MSEVFQLALETTPKVSEFKNLAEYIHWKTVVTGIKERYDLDDRTLLSVINMRISGKIVAMLQNMKFLTMEQFWAHMDKAHGIALDASSRVEIMNTLVNPPDSIRTIEEYIFHFEESLYRLSGLFKNESDKILLFLMPLNPVIAHSIQIDDPKTLEETKELAIKCSIMLPDRVFREEIHGVQHTKNSNEPSFPSDNNTWESPPTSRYQSNNTNESSFPSDNNTWESPPTSRYQANTTHEPSFRSNNPTWKSPPTNRYQGNNSNEYSFPSNNTTRNPLPLNNHQVDKDMSMIDCRKCKQLGHYARDCTMEKNNVTQFGGPGDHLNRRNKRTRGNGGIRRRTDRGFSNNREQPQH